MIYLESVFLTQLPGDYTSSVPAVKALTRKPLRFAAPVTFFVGENGSGKSTLLEAIAAAWGFNPEGGSRNIRFETTPDHTYSELYRALCLVRSPHRPRDGYFLRAESFYNVISELDALDRIPAAAPPLSASYGGRSLHTRSHGEGFLDLVTYRFGGRGLYLLDEPEAALSPTRQLALLAEFGRLSADSQLIIATHSPILLAMPGAEIYTLDETGMRLTPYRETELYRLTRDFLENPDRILRYIFQEEKEDKL